MSTLDVVIADIINDTPTGEINNVINDLKAIVDKNIDADIEEALEAYNLKNLITVSVGGEKVILSKYNQIDDKFYTPATGKVFSVDHSKRQAFDVEEFETFDSKTQVLYDELSNYTIDKYPGEHAYAIYPQENGTLAILIVDNKFSPNNFWNGNWDSEYIYDPSSNELKGDIALDIHYYEDGNVRLKTNESVDETVSSPSELVAKIAEIEDSVQKKLNKSFVELNERAFKSLRRQLPITRSKVNWGKAIGNYRLGKDVAGEE